MKLWKFNSGIYPVIPGLVISLGDYGYWENDQWCHVGNICEIPACPRTFCKKTDYLGQDVYACVDVSIECALGIEAGNENIAAGAKLVFDTKNSLFFKGRFNDYERFSSIDMEIKPFLMKLQSEGKWEDNYWLAYYVVYSDRFISMRSKKAGASVTVNGDLTLENINVPSAGVLASLTFDRDAIETTVGCGDEKKYAGAKFLSLHSSGLFKRKVKIKYNKENQSVTMD